MEMKGAVVTLLLAAVAALVAGASCTEARDEGDAGVSVDPGHCDRVCEHLAEAACPGTRDDCASRCREMLDRLTGDCVEPVRAFLVCVEGAAITCDDLGLAAYPACDEEAAAAVPCTQAGGDQGQGGGGGGGGGGVPVPTETRPAT